MEEGVWCWKNKELSDYYEIDGISYKDITKTLVKPTEKYQFDSFDEFASAKSQKFFWVSSFLY